MTNIRAFLVKLENSTPLKQSCDACDAVTAGATTTYPQNDLVTSVTEASVLRHLPTVEEQQEQTEDVLSDLDEREAMALEGGVPPAFAPLFAVMQVARPASVDVNRWNQAVNDAGVFLDTWGGIEKQLGWNGREIMGPQFTPAALAWALKGTHVVSLTATRACLSDGRIFIRILKEFAHEQS